MSATDEKYAVAHGLRCLRGDPLLIGWMHEGRFFGECLIGAIRFFKHETLLWREFLRRLKWELTTWKADP